MPSIVLILRDPAHVIRPSCRDPLHDADQFKAQYDRLFGGRHAVLSDFHNFIAWRDQLEACQREEILERGELPGGMNHVLRHIAYVQPRFESFVAPRRRYVCLLRQIAQVLVVKAYDTRLSNAMRARAKDALEAMNAIDCFTAGLAADYGEVCLEFLRAFDTSDHDPSRTSGEINDFVKALGVFSLMATSSPIFVETRRWA